MSARQKLSRISRCVSANICRHSSCGRTVTRILDRSTVTELSESSSDLLSAGTTRSRAPVVISSLLPSPVTAKSSASSAISSTRNCPRS